MGRRQGGKKGKCGRWGKVRRLQGQEGLGANKKSSQAEKFL